MNPPTRPALLVVVALCVTWLAACETRPPSREPLNALWSAYTQHYVSADGAVADVLRDGNVTSEAQSYVMLRAVWMNDRATFDRTWQWTQAHLTRPDGLHAWLWNPATGQVADANSATDGDEDIAFALVLASQAFQRPDYLARARTIVQAIRGSAAIATHDGWLPSAGNWAGAERIINFSYFAPYAYRYFDRLDPDGGWSAAVDSSYRALDQVITHIAPLLPPDFAVWTADGQLTVLPPQSALSRDFSYDGIRILWRLELDCRVMQEHRACVIVDRLIERIERLRQRDGRFRSRYALSGRALADDESPSFAAAFLPAYTRRYPEVAARLRQTTLGPDVLAAIRDSRDRYYDANWVWFGLAAADGVIAARLPSLDDIERAARAEPQLH